MKNYFITVTGIQHYYGFEPFKIDRIVKLSKDRENQYDSEAIAVKLPFIGTIGYVANSTHTVFQGTFSAGRIYDKFYSSCYAKILFITHSSVIAQIVPRSEGLKAELKLRTEMEKEKPTEENSEEDFEF